MISPAFPTPLPFLVALGLTLATAAGSGDFALSASLQVDEPSVLLFDGESTDAELEVIAHPIDATTWSGIKVRLVTADLDGERLISSSPISLRITKPGSRSSTSVSLNRWYSASYLGLKQNAPKLGVHLAYRRASKKPVEFFVEIDSERAEAAETRAA